MTVDTYIRDKEYDIPYAKKRWTKLNKTVKAYAYRDSLNNLKYAFMDPWQVDKDTLFYYWLTDFENPEWGIDNWELKITNLEAKNNGKSILNWKVRNKWFNLTSSFDSPDPTKVKWVPASNIQGKMRLTANNKEIWSHEQEDHDEVKAFKWYEFETELDINPLEKDIDFRLEVENKSGTNGEKITQNIIIKWVRTENETIKIDFGIKNKNKINVIFDTSFYNEPNNKSESFEFINPIKRNHDFTSIKDLLSFTYEDSKKLFKTNELIKSIENTKISFNGIPNFQEDLLNSKNKLYISPEHIWKNITDIDPKNNQLKLIYDDSVYYNSLNKKISHRSIGRYDFKIKNGFILPPQQITSNGEIVLEFSIKTYKKRNFKVTIPIMNSKVFAGEKGYHKFEWLRDFVDQKEKADNDFTNGEKYRIESKEINNKDDFDIDLINGKITKKITTDDWRRWNDNAST